MSRKTFVVFGLLVVFLAVLIPWLAFRSNGDAATGAQEVPADLKEGQSSSRPTAAPATRSTRRAPTATSRRTSTNCWPRTGRPRPNAQQTIEATEGRVLNAIDDGVDSSTTPGRMPAGILNEQQAEAVAEFVAHTAGEG